MSALDAKQRACRVLIVEDDQDDVFLFKRALDGARSILDCDIETEEIDNGLDALCLVSRQDLTEKLPDVLVLDLNMPRLDGIRFLKSLRQSLLLKDLPVFVLTTTTATSIHEEAMRAGADRVYVKPNDAQALLSIALDMVGAGCGPDCEARRACSAIRIRKNGWALSHGWAPCSFQWRLEPAGASIPKPELSYPMLVGIGASAGGLEALKALLPALPSDRGLAFVIVVHLRAGQPSVMAEVLQPFSALPVTQVTEDQDIEPNHIYVIPPGCNLSTGS
ncbi:MAG: chemotaxis protein CheB [Methylocystis sp.]